jgi:hypothetical protein
MFSQYYQCVIIVHNTFIYGLKVYNTCQQGIVCLIPEVDSVGENHSLFRIT